MKKYIHTVIFILIFIICVVYFKTKSNQIDKEILNNKYETTGEVFKLNFGAKNVSITYRYNFKGDTLVSTYPVTSSNYNKFLNRKYKVICDSLAPHKNIIYLNEPL